MIRAIADSWNAFWFQPAARSRVNATRVAVCSVTAVWLASFLSSASAWFSSDGLLSTTLAGQLIEYEETASWQNWSPLWFSDASSLAFVWLSVGIVLAIIAASGWSGRISLGVLLFWIIAWGHRISWLQGPVEPALVACLGYLMVEPGTKLWGKAVPATATSAWTAGLTLRLVQTHWWILVAGGLLTQLASLTWWRGEVAWWLASADRSHLLSLELLRGGPTLTNLISHAMVIVPMLALWWMSLRVTRPLGIVMAIGVSLIYALLADHILYGLFLAACLPAFFAQRK